MNYSDELHLYINTVWQRLDACGWKAAARSVEAAVNDAGESLPKLMAAADHAAYHEHELNKSALTKINQFDQDCF